MKKLKRGLQLFVSFLMVFTLAACSGATENSEPANETAKTTGSDQKSLVVYFSGTGNTKRVAEKVADLTDSALFEIVPEKPYTAQDLNFNDETSRVVDEHENEEKRDMSLQTQVPENWDQYDTVYLGYPIWWGIAAWPTDAFVKGVDWNGKMIYPFCTTFSSGVGNSVELLKEEADGGDWKEGIRFAEHPDDEEISEWLDSIS